MACALTSSDSVCFSNAFSNLENDIPMLSTLVKNCPAKKAILLADQKKLKIAPRMAKMPTIIPMIRETSVAVIWSPFLNIHHKPPCRARGRMASRTNGRGFLLLALRVNPVTFRILRLSAIRETLRINGIFPIHVLGFSAKLRSVHKTIPIRLVLRIRRTTCKSRRTNQQPQNQKPCHLHTYFLSCPWAVSYRIVN